MYLRIEKEFKKKSKNRKYQLLFVLGVFIYSFTLSNVLVLGVGLEKSIGTYILITFSSLIPFYLVCYGVILLTVKKYEKISFSQILDIENIKNKYQEIIYKEDIKILTEILKQNKINTRPKVQETIRHYQCMLPRRIESTGKLLTILAFAISIMALLFSDTVISSMKNVQVIFVIVFVVVVMYWGIHIIEKNYFRIFGKEELYIRLEASLSEIFMIYYLKDEDKKNG